MEVGRQERASRKRRHLLNVSRKSALARWQGEECILGNWYAWSRPRIVAEPGPFQEQQVGLKTTAK